MASKSEDRPERARTGLAGWSAIIATWVGILGAFGGGFMGLAKYGEEVDKMEDGRVVQTFALFEMFNSSERLASRQRIFDYMQKEEVLEMNNNDLYVFLDFYDALQVCVDRELCDRDLSVRLFQSYAVPVWGHFEDMIVGGRTKSDPNFGGGLQWMAGLPAPTPFATAPAGETKEEPAAPAAEAATEAPSASVAAPEAAAPTEEKAPAPAP